MSRAGGVFISIAHDGTVVIDRGYVRPEDEAPAECKDPIDAGGEGGLTGSAIEQCAVTMGGQSAEPEEDGDGDGAIKPLPDKLITELTAHRRWRSEMPWPTIPGSP